MGFLKEVFCRVVPLGPSRGHFSHVLREAPLRGSSGALVAGSFKGVLQRGLLGWPFNGLL